MVIGYVVGQVHLADIVVLVGLLVEYRAGRTVEIGFIDAVALTATTAVRELQTIAEEALQVIVGPEKAGTAGDAELLGDVVGDLAEDRLVLVIAFLLG